MMAGNKKARRRVRRFMRAALAAALAAGLVFLPGCRQTDFLKEIVFAAWTDIVDENNTVVVNNPDAEKESEAFPPYDLVDVESTSDVKQNIVVYSSNPNMSAVTTRHSVFDLHPRFAGIEAEQGVRFEESDVPDALDHEVAMSAQAQAESQETEDSAEESEQPPDEPAESENPEEGEQSPSEPSDPGAGGAADDSPADTGDAAAGDAVPDAEPDGGGSNSNSEDDSGEAGGTTDAGEGSEPASDPADGSSGGDPEDDSGEGGSENPGDGAGGDAGGNPDDDPEEDDADDDDGRSARESGGYGGDDITYDPGNELLDPEKCDHVAAIGQAAVIAQAVGGKNAVVAMDEYTFTGKSAAGGDATYASSFSAVFADELADGFASDALLWSRDGSHPSDLTSKKKLIKACADADTGKGGTIVFCGNLGSQKDFFSSKQLESFQAAGIQLLPIDLSTAQGAIDAFVALGKVLEDSDEVSLPEGKTPAGNAADFRDAYDNILSAAAATHGNVLAVKQYSASVFSDFRDLSFGGAFYDVHCAVADSFEKGLTYVSDEVSMDTTGGVLFSTSRAGMGNSPLAFYMQAGGVLNQKSLDDNSPNWTNALIPYAVSKSADHFKGYAADSALTNKVSKLTLLDAGHWNVSDSPLNASDSVGSYLMPYLIVASCENASGTEVKSAVIAQSEKKGTPYYPPHVQGTAVVPGDIMHEKYGKDEDDPWISGCLGAQHDFKGSVFWDKGVSFADCVRVNPCGLLGDWVVGTPESVLESIWIADLYSKYPKKSDYKSHLVTSMDGFSVSLYGEECGSVKDAVKAFYRGLYRCSLSDAGVSYEDVVPDSGEGLKSGE